MFSTLVLVAMHTAIESQVCTFVNFALIAENPSENKLYNPQVALQKIQMIHLVVSKNQTNVNLKKGIVMKTVNAKLVLDVEQTIVRMVSHQIIIVATNQQVSTMHH